MATIVIVLIIVGLGAAALLGRTADSRDPEYGLGRLVGRLPDLTDPTDRAEDTEAVQAPGLTVPAAWLTERDAQLHRPLASGVDSLG
ncbi:MAG: hypothetical protein QOJ11_3289 [Frankiales bacterium]|jgi:hypothetical protein|nr:hypothetical protein [Frankiales bacterium]